LQDLSQPASEQPRSGVAARSCSPELQQRPRRTTDARFGRYFLALAPGPSQVKENGSDSLASETIPSSRPCQVYFQSIFSIRAMAFPMQSFSTITRKGCYRFPSSCLHGERAYIIQASMILQIGEPRSIGPRRPDPLFRHPETRPGMRVRIPLDGSLPRRTPGARALGWPP
jgi:hypothetical protein